MRVVVSLGDVLSVKSIGLLGRLMRAVVLALVVGAIASSYWGVKAVALDQSATLPPTAVVEVLQFRVSADDREAFIAKDADIWTAALQNHPGFISKSVWIPPNNPERVQFVITWASRQQWKSFPVDVQAELDRQMQPFDAKLEQVEEYQVVVDP